jgi:hypothetical protein
VREVTAGGISYLVFFSIVALSMNGDALLASEGANALYLYLLPFLALCRTLIFLPYFRREMRATLSNEERDTDTHRGLDLTLAGFCFAAYFLLVVEAAKPTLNQGPDFSLSVYYMFISFLMFQIAFWMEAYNFHRWCQEVILGVEEVGRLGIFSSAIAVLFATNFAPYLKFVITALALLGWLFNFIVHLVLRYKFLSAIRRYDR